MKNQRRIITIGIISLVVIIAACLGLYFYLKSDHLTVEERKWIDQASKSNQVININVLNDANIFGNNGSGIFYDLLNDFANYYRLNINKVTYNHEALVSGVTLGIKNNIGNNDIVLYDDHYVLISKKYELLNDYNDVVDKKIGILNEDYAYVSKYVNNDTVTYFHYDNITELLKSSDDYLILPLHLYLENILDSNYMVVYHLSDIKSYYVLSVLDNDVLSSIIRKYCLKWEKELNSHYDKEMYSLLLNTLKISSSEAQEMQNKTYNYGFINNSPYEVISGGKYGGIIAMYLKDFNRMADIDMKYTRYRSFNSFVNALNNDKVDLYFSHYGENNRFIKTVTGIKTNYVVVANNINDIVVNSINSLVGKTVYVEKNSIINNYLKSIKGIDIKTFDNVNQLSKMNNKDNIIVLDESNFTYLQKHGLNNYTIRYSNSLDSEYHFAFKSNDAYFKMFSKYINIVDNYKMYNKGIYDHERVMKIGNAFSMIATYFLGFLLLLGLFYLVSYRRSKRVKIAKKIKKDDTLRFVDQLTLLKNRSYLSENIKEWGKNTIYPQTILVMDLNHIQSINDLKGYEEGDRQIKAAANILIKTQLDNTDIIRTDGNEFVVYMVGYSQKQITNYIHKLNKELKKLPYNYGAEFGYSMILDDIKTIEDALNEATKSLKKHKELNEEKN